MVESRELEYRRKEAKESGGKDPVSRGKETFRNSGSLLLVYVHVDIAVRVKWDDDSRISPVTTAETSKTSSSSPPSPATTLVVCSRYATHMEAEKRNYRGRRGGNDDDDDDDDSCRISSRE